MRGTARFIFLTAILVAVPGVAVAAGARVGVKPSSGTPRTRFVVHFTAPDASGRIGGMNREYVVSANGPTGRRHCLDTVTVTPPRVKAHARVRVTLSPAALNGKWCLGRWSGNVEELESPICPPRQLCPAFAVLEHRLGTFRFRVHPRQHR